jgi:hypothetical protein
VAQSSNWFWAFENYVFVSDRPEKLNFDERNQLHAENEMAYRFRDGRGDYFWHGVKVNQKIIMAPETLTLEDVEKESNQEVRRIMVERMGRPKFIKAIGGAQALVHEDSHELNGQRALYKYKDLAFLEVADPSTGRIYYLDVPAETKTCEEANAFLENDELGEPMGKLVAAS